VTRIARDFDCDEKAWTRFARSFWQRARDQDRPHVGIEKRSKIAFVTRFVFKARNKRMLQLTSKYAGVLQYLIADGVKPENMARELKKRRIGKTHRLVTKKPRPSGRKNEKPSDPIDIVEKRPHGNDRSRDKTKGPIFRWNTRTKKAVKKHDKVNARVLLNCDVIEPKNGRTCYKVVEVTERK
jgi:hypothetical protein